MIHGTPRDRIQGLIGALVIVGGLSVLIACTDPESESSEPSMLIFAPQHEYWISIENDYDLKVIEFSPQSDPSRVCVHVDGHYSDTLQCWKKGE